MQRAVALARLCRCGNAWRTSLDFYRRTAILCGEVAGAGGRGAARAEALSRALPGVQRPPLSPARLAGARRALLLRLREESSADGGAGGPAARPRPPSAPARAAALLRGVAAPRWQPPSLACPGPRAVVYADRDRRRCEQATALYRAAGGGRERGGDHDRPARGSRALRRAHGSLYGSRPLGRAHPDLGERPRPPPADPGGPSPGPAWDRAHPGLFPASARPE